MKKIVKQRMVSKKGTIIEAGEEVDIRFDVKTKSGGTAQNCVSVNTADGRRIITDGLKRMGFRVPTIQTMNKWIRDGVAKSVFGERVEPDGIDEHGSPSWILFLGLI
jgi:hypothetical protein